MKFFLLFFAFLSFNSFAETLYVKSMVTNLFSEPVNGSSKIGSLVRGEEVTSIESKQEWIKISNKKLTGWVKSVFLSKTEPMKKVSVLDSNADISSTARKRASGFTSTAAARGLAESGRKRIGLMQRPDYDALKVMEKNTIDEKKAIEFLNKEVE